MNALKEVHLLVSTNRLSAARARIRKLASRKLSRAARLQLAFLARQSGLPEATVGLLNRIVRERAGRSGVRATDEEKAEYAMGLIHLSATSEAIELLGEVDLSRLPRAAHFLAFAHFREWNFDAPRAILQKLAKSSQATDLDRTRANVLLGVSYLHGTPDLERSLKFLEAARSATSPTHFPRTHWDCWQLTAQNLIHQRRWDDADQALARAEDLMAGDEDTASALMTAQWRAIHSIHTAAGTAARARALESLTAVRKAFEDSRRWENARSCAYYQTLLNRDEPEALRLYFGTPYPSFRAKLAQALGWTESGVPTTYDHVLGSSSARRRVVIDVMTGQLRDSQSQLLKPGQVQSRLLAALTADLFNPPDIVRLGALLYPDDKYNPVSTPVKVRQALKRLRQWLRQAEVPLIVSESEERYGLETTQGAQVTLVLNRLAEGADARLFSLLEKLRQEKAGEGFDSATVERLTGLSRRSALRLLEDALAGGFVRRIGHGPGTRYFIDDKR